MYPKNVLLILMIVSAAVVFLDRSPAAASGLSWPIDCVPGIDCTGATLRIGYPDVDGNGRSFSCGKPGYTGHQGTDIMVSSVEQRTAVLAAADGIVLWTEDGLYDHCPDDDRTDCSEERISTLPLSSQSGASLGFNAGNFVVIEHMIGQQRYLTLYAHLRTASLRVSRGARVRQGQQLGDAASSGNAQTPHLHFGVYRAEGTHYRPVDPWEGSCNNSSHGLWASMPPYYTENLLLAHPEGSITNDSVINLQSLQRSAAPPTSFD